MFVKKVFLSALIVLLTIQSCKKDNRAYHKDGDVIKLMYNRPDGINIIVLGDGFIKEDLTEGGKFDQKVKEMTDFLFTVEPFKQYKNFFNIYQVYAESNVRGAANSYTPGRTKFDTYYGAISDRHLVTGNYESVVKYASLAIPQGYLGLLVVLSNDDRDGGTGGGIITLSTNKRTNKTFVHEIGHSFAGLGDEYIEEAIADNYTLDLLQYIPNLDNTSDIDKIKWSHFLKNEAYQKWVGAFEGGYYRTKGIYRPQYYSVMYNSAYPWFNAPSREAIVRTIYSQMHLPFDMEAFLKDDAKNIDPTEDFNKAQADIVRAQAPTFHNDFIDIKQRVIQLHMQRISGEIKR